jgi:long-chain acyl-CoA synthetase
VLAGDMNEWFIAELFGPALEAVRTSQWFDRATGKVLAGDEFRRQTLAKADEMRARGITAGQVAVIRESSPLSFAVNYLAAGMLGAVLLPMEKGLAPHEEARRLALARPTVVIDDQNTTTIETGQAPISLSRDIAQILFTGGTTGAPKAVLHTHHGLVSNVRAIAHWTNYGPGDLVLGTLPLFHCYGIMWTVLAPLLTGASVEAFGRLSISELLDAAPSPTAWPTVPAGVEAVLRSPAIARVDWSRLRFCIVGGAPSAGDLSGRFKRLTGRPVLNGYGVTEATSFVCAPELHTQSQEPGDVGAPVADVRIRAGTRYGEYAELEIGGPSVMAGYLGDPEATARTLTGDGWLHTGDLFELGRSGAVLLRGRLKNFINRGGEKIDPASVVAAVTRHQAVMDAFVFGLPDDTLGEIVACAVETTEAVDVEQLRNFLAGLLSPYEVPSVIHVVPHLPRNAAGKIIADEVRKLIPAACGIRSA